MGSRREPNPDHAGWFDNRGASQYFFDHGNCYNMTAEPVTVLLPLGFTFAFILFIQTRLFAAAGRG